MRIPVVSVDDRGRLQPWGEDLDIPDPVPPTWRRPCEVQYGYELTDFEALGSKVPPRRGPAVDVFEIRRSPFGEAVAVWVRRE